MKDELMTKTASPVAADAAGTARENPLRLLAGHGQAVWLDYIQRGALRNGELARMIRDDDLRGVTSNPAIFEKAIAGSADYDRAIGLLAGRTIDAKSAYECLAIADIRDAADLLRPVYDRTAGRDGYVSLEVSPTLAQDGAGTLAEARRLWRALGRPNAMIKVPATPAGTQAIETLIAEGINVNVTLLFAREAYEAVALAYLRGLERRRARGEPLARVASVASFFISRIDAAVDGALAEGMRTGNIDASHQSLMGRVAIANAKLTYERYRQLFSGDRWEVLARAGAQTQRVLWASTGTKNPDYRDTIYVESLIGPDTVNTIPPATLDAFRDHGRVKAGLVDGLDAARAVMRQLDDTGISMKALTARLLDEGVRLFDDAFAKLLAAVDAKLFAMKPTTLNAQAYHLPAALDAAVNHTLPSWRDRVARLWSKDATLWTGGDESKWLGWLTIVAEQLGRLDAFSGLAREAGSGTYDDVVLLGMGGSSLAPEVLATTFGHQPGFPRLHILDSTDPAQVRAVEARVDPRRTLFVVASKSGSTLEPNIFKQYFFDRVQSALGATEAGRRFIAITDPGSKMEQVAMRDGFRHVLHGVPSIGGRYSALSHFGMVPAALMGVDVRRFLESAHQMVQACGAEPEANPGVMLGVVLGEAAKAGRDKLTIVASPGILDLGAWLEQLIAESTGKIGRGIIPVDRESVGPPEVYGDDRIFAYLRLATAPDAAQDAAIAALEAAGQPVVRIDLREPHALGQEFFRWEIATAVAGAVIGIHPFDQPDVEASKIATRALTDEYEARGALPAEQPFLEVEGVRLFADQANAQAILARAATDRSLAGCLRAHLARAGRGDYVALLAYVHMDAANEHALAGMRHAVRDAKQVATCLGFGPRFLHSTGQAYKGGPDSGVFLQVTCDDAADLAVPGQTYTFGTVKSAQARGDFQVLADRGRRALRVHLGADVPAGLARLDAAVRAALR